MRKAVLAIAAAAAAAAVAVRVFHGPAPASAAPRGIVLITIDTLRADRLDGGAMPRLGRFAAGGRRFTHARTTAPLTLPAHASVMTGLLPPVHGARDNGVPLDGRHPTIAEALRGAGFRTAAFVSAFVLDRQFGLARGFETYDDAVARDPEAALRLEAERAGSATVDAARAWAAAIDRSRERFFLWVHLFEPHAPYPGGYDQDVAAADAQAARLIDELSAGPGGQAIAWIVAGDHGEALGSHGEATHGMLLYDATLRVPLFLRGPGIAASTESAPVSLADLAPTILRWAGLDAPPAMQGADLRGVLPRDRDVYSETMYPRAAGWHGLSALSGSRWKAIRWSATELYDVAADPEEARDAAAAHPRIAEAMGAAAARLAGRADAAAAPVSAEAQERLRALGYVGGGASSGGDRTGAPNPAREIASWVAFERALTILAAGRGGEALADLAGLAAAYPGGRVFTSTYARALVEAGEPARAVPLYRALVAGSPADAMLFHDLASAARAAGDAREAARAAEAAIAIDPGNAAALNGLGLLHADAGRAADAARAFERAAARDPRHAPYWANLGNARRALGQLPGADAAYQRALAIAPGHADALNGRGALLVQSGRAGDAIALFERVLARDPDHVEARLNLGIAYQESGRLADAAVTYREVLARAKAGSREHRAAATLLGLR